MIDIDWNGIISGTDTGDDVEAKLTTSFTIIETTLNALDVLSTANAADVVLLDGRVTVNEADIVLVEDRVTVNEADIADHEIRLVDIENSGMTVRTGSNIAPQTIAITATRVVSFDTTAVEVGVGTLWDTVNLRMKATSDGVFKLRYESFVSYASNVNITWQIYKNGATFGSSITLSGQGSTIFPLVLLSSTNLLADDYLELHATASSSTALTVVQANGTLEKTHF